ncbi:MAG: hypothetical protein ACE366_20005 [Bradymonadia bacterium]
MRILLSPMAVPMMMAMLAGCGDESLLAPEVGEPRIPDGRTCFAEDSDPDVDVSFQVLVAQVLEPRCSCHTISGGLGQVVGRLNLANYDAALSGGVRAGDETIIPGDPCGSALYLKTTDTPPFGARMPFDGTGIRPEEQQMIIDWIADGALP